VAPAPLLMAPGLTMSACQPWLLRGGEGVRKV
jgi:hypothetical protein